MTRINRRFAKRPLLLIFAVTGLWFLVGCSSSPPEKVFSDGFNRPHFSISTEQSRVTVHGLSPGALNYLQQSDTDLDLEGVMGVYSVEPGQPWSDSVLPSAGSWLINGEELVFNARHDWLPGTTYYARLDANRIREGAGVYDTTFVIPTPEGLEPQQVTGVFPSSDSLPQNLLKFYIRFSGPMSRDGVYEHISILNEKGDVVPDAFLELPQELWDPLATRLTILFDPGRIKRGLERHNLVGIPFEPGNRYTLVIDSSLKDGNGLPLASEYQKSFYITEPDRSMPVHSRWEIISPSANTTDPLELHFDEPLDHGLLHRVITVKKAGGPITGSVQTQNEERTWQFTPVRPWQKGTYTIEIETILEDLAGNNLKSVFDIDMAEKQDRQANPNIGPTIKKRFEIK